MKTQLKRTKWLTGSWGQAPLELWDIRYEFTHRKSGVKVVVVDINDGEIARTSKTRWYGHALHFELYWRSNKYRTINQIRPLSQTRAVHTCSYWETWLKLGPWLLGKSAPKEFWGDPRNRSNWIRGSWFDPEGWKDNIDVFRKENGKLDVGCGPGASASKVKWNGNALRFTVFTPEYDCYDIYALKPLSHTKAELQVTEDFTLIKCDL